MDLGIKGKKVLITGASQGIGREIALSFAREGCKVSIIARSEEKLKKVLEEMGGEEKGHCICVVDLLPEGNPTKAVSELIEKNKGYDIVVHNIGGTLGVRDVISPVEDWNRVWRFNVGIAIEINRLVIPYMREQKWGRIINTSSQSAEGLRGCGAYGASKAYLNAYTKVLGKGVAKDGIIVSAISPGSIYAEGSDWDENSPKNIDNKEAFFKKKEDFLRHHMAIGRLGTAEEIAPFVLFMASKYVT